MKHDTSSTAQGGGGSFKDRKLSERWAVVMHGLQSELMDRKVVGVVRFRVVAGTSPTTAGCSVVYCTECSCSCSCSSCCSRSVVVVVVVAAAVVAVATAGVVEVVQVVEVGVGVGGGVVSSSSSSSSRGSSSSSSRSQ